MGEMKLLEDRTSTVLYNVLDYLYMDMFESNYSYRDFTKICRNEIGMTSDEAKRFFSELNAERSGIFEDNADFENCMRCVDDVYAGCL